MKVFLSHSTKDKEFVEKLAAAIVGADFDDPWLCEVDVEKNDNFVAEIEKGLTACDVALVVWSPDAAKSNWTTEEWTSVLSRQVKEQRVRLGIVMLRDCPLPELLRTKNYISAQRDQQAGLRDTIDWLKRRKNAQRLSGLNAPIYLPDYRPQDFVGRSVQLERLRGTLLAEPTVFLLHGEPGTGKSTLALQFAWDAQKDFDAVIFQTCGQRPLDAITAELVERLPIEVKTLAPDQQRTAAKTWLRQRQSLLVLDDVWPNGDGKIEVTQLEPGPGCSVLYTSRRQALPGVTPKQTSKVEKFTDAEAEELFHTYLDPAFNKDDVDQNRQVLLDFAARVEMLPIGVAVGASLLRDMSAIALGKAVLKLKVSALADGEKNVNDLFAQAIKSQPEREQKLLAACAVCVQEGFWLPLAAQIAELTEDEADEAANALVRGSLLRVLDRDRQRFQLHALLREQLQARAGTDAVAELRERHAAALEVMFKDWETRWRDCRECLDEIIPAAAFLWSPNDGEREASLTYKGFELARRIGEYSAGLRIAKHEELLWAGAVDQRGRLCLSRGYRYQAMVSHLWGELQDALDLYKKEEEISLELGNKAGLQASYGNQALILRRWGRSEEALTLHKKEEAICLEMGDKDGLQGSYGNQAIILEASGRTDEAMQLLKEQEAICLEMGNQESLQRSYGNQALILIKQGHLAEALAALQKSEAICVELGLKRDLGYCYWQWADLDAARGNRAAEKQKLQLALALFTELKMPLERDAVEAALDQPARLD